MNLKVEVADHLAMTHPSFKQVPVVDVHRNNFNSFWPSILFACRDASFIGLDVELSGLGPRRNLVTK